MTKYRLIWANTELGEATSLEGVLVFVDHWQREGGTLTVPVRVIQNYDGANARFVGEISVNAVGCLIWNFYGWRPLGGDDE